MGRPHGAAAAMTGHTAEIAILAAYYAVLALLALYGSHRAIMVRLYMRHKNAHPRAGVLEELPRVTVQLPIYNEVYVVERLIDAVASFDYPKDRLEIQVLDDSTDETREIAAASARRWRARGVDVVHIARDRREGFKAGALQAGLEAARGEFFLIFDADFLPDRGLLRQMLPYFADAGVGMVQARWEHLNRDYSLMTRIQSILLDGHFVIEHTARHRSGRFFNFNGTAGMWRRRCLEEAGGWQADTLTEDLDLSYRAQLAGWRFVYLKDVAVPAELPVEMDGFKSQQYRWTKGSIETARKLLPRVLTSRFPARVKWEAFFHLSNNLSHLLVVALALLMVPAIVIRDRIGWTRLVALDFPLFFGASLSFLAFYAASQREIGRDWRASLRYLPILLSFGIGLSLSNVRGVVEALVGRRSGFDRTPKYSIEGTTGEWRRKKYRAEGPLSVAGEVVFASYFLIALVFAVTEGYWASVPFLLIFANGFGATAMLSWKSRRERRAPAALAPTPALEAPDPIG